MGIMIMIFQIFLSNLAYNSTHIQIVNCIANIDKKFIDFILREPNINYIALSSPTVIHKKSVIEP